MYYSGPTCVKLRQVSGDVVPLHHLRGLGGVCGVLQERQPPSQDGEAQVQPGKGATARQCPRALLFEQPPGVKEAEPGPYLPVLRREANA